MCVCVCVLAQMIAPSKGGGREMSCRFRLDMFKIQLPKHRYNKQQKCSLYQFSGPLFVCVCVCMYMGVCGCVHARGCMGVVACVCVSGLRAEASADSPDTTLAEPHPNSNTQQSKNNSANVVVQQHIRKLLKMGILMPKTC